MVHFADQDTIVRKNNPGNNFDTRTVVSVVAWRYKAWRRKRFSPFGLPASTGASVSGDCIRWSRQP
jgi:hypothetical protein